MIPEKDVKELWNMVFNLSLNFLHNETAAEDATQEIFLKAAGAASSFRYESSPGTWIYRIAYNYLIDQKRLQFKDEISFELFEYDVSHYKPFENEISLSEKEMSIYIEQIKTGCTKALLQCLRPSGRFVFIIGKIFGFDSKEGAYICGITEDAYRQKLSRAAKKISNFMHLNCGLVNKDATCQCKKRISVALERERINPDMLLHHTESEKIKDYLGMMNDLDETARIYRDNPYIDKLDMFDETLYKNIKDMADETI